MKLNLILIGIIILLLGGIYILFGKYKDKSNKLAISESNVVQLMKPDTTEKANVIILTPKQYKEIASKTDELLKENKILKKDVKELHSIKYKIGSVKSAKTDTSWHAKSIQPIGETLELNYPYKETNMLPYNLTWYFDHGCFQNIVTFDPSINQATDSLTGEIQINRIVSIVRPNLWFWKLKWRKSKWATETKVISNCPELNIKENTVIQVR